MDYLGFKYKSDECDEIARLLRTEGYAQAEIEDEDEMDTFFSNLEVLGVYRIDDADEDDEALDPEDEPLFYTRIALTDTQGASINELEEDRIWFLDFFFGPSEGEEIFDDDEFF